MTAGTLASLDFTRYQRMLRGLLPGADFALRDSSGFPCGPGAEFEGFSASGDAEDLYRRPMVDESGEEIGTLFLLAREEGGRPGSSVAETLEIMAESICNDLRMTTELDAMAGELGERYEELNLVYQAVDEVRDIAEGREALFRLVRNCAEYMGAAMALLLLPEKKITLYHIGADTLIPDAPLVVEQMDRFCRGARAKTESLVLNERTDPMRRLLHCDLPYKLLSCPVFGGSGDDDGTLILLNHQEREDFTNSDRNLLEVMARHASKIIGANYDPSTGLLSRNAFEYSMERALVSTRLDGVEHAVLNINLDRFQVVNDTLGRQAGDRLIGRLAQLLGEQVRGGDAVARLGGDEFGVLLHGCPLERARVVAEKIREGAGRLDFRWGRERCEASVSIGVASMASDAESVSSVFDAAEVACGVAKEKGRDRVQVYRQGDADLTRRKEEMHWVGRIREALREDRFTLFAQPIVPLKEEVEEVHFEILLRLRDEEGALLSPAEFIPAAERYGLMPAIDRWVLGRALEMLSRSRQGQADRQASWSINLSGASLGDGDFLEFIVEQVKTADIRTDMLGFEITETEAIGNLAEARRFIAAMKREGCSFSLDDFGSGVSSFAYLKDLPVDYLKIDGAFVTDLTEDPISDAMVVAMNQVGHLLGKRTIAEFVRTEAIGERLAEIGVDYAQGYGVGMPRPLEEVLADLAGR